MPRLGGGDGLGGAREIEGYGMGISDWGKRDTGDKEGRNQRQLLNGLEV